MTVVVISEVHPVKDRLKLAGATAAKAKLQQQWGFQSEASGVEVGEELIEVVQSVQTDEEVGEEEEELKDGQADDGADGVALSREEDEHVREGLGGGDGERDN